MRYCLALDMPADPALIAEYEEWHRKVWPEIKQSIFDSGIDSMDIYRIENRLIMFLATGPDFSFERKAAMDDANPIVQKWESMMSKYQVVIPGGKPGVKWRVAENIFSLNK